MNNSSSRRPMESWVLLHPPQEPYAFDRPPPPRRPSRRNVVFAVAAWVVIAALVVLIAVAQAFRERMEVKGEQPDKARAALQQAQGGFEARYVVGASSTGLMDGRMALTQLESLRKGPVEKQLRYAVLSGELIGPSAALDALEDIETQAKEDERELKAENRKTLDVLKRLYNDYAAARFDAPSVAAKEKNFLEQQLGWEGQLALTPAGAEAPEDIEAAGAALAAALAKAEGTDPLLRAEVLAPAQWTFLGILLIIGMIGGLGLLGFFGIIICLVLYAEGTIRSQMVMKWGNGGIYAEAFAVWMLLFIVVGLGVPFLPLGLPPLLLSALGSFLSLAALGWPVLRGISWQTMREEVGLNFGKRPWLEILFGPVCYAMTLPLAFIGILLTLGLMLLHRYLMGDAVADDGGLLSPETGPTHPIVGYLVNADWWQRIQILLVASIAAPIVEEIVFRGLLYRHLRGLTRGIGLVLSVLVSGFIVSFVFAIIHPQGILALPALMSLALGFTLMREWRGSLVAPIIAHGMNNGILMILAFVIFG